MERKGHHMRGVIEGFLYSCRKRSKKEEEEEEEEVQEVQEDGRKRKVEGQRDANHLHGEYQDQCTGPF